jgi:rhamnose transport system ATP-binding protein
MKSQTKIKPEHEPVSPVLALEDVTKTFPGVKALSDVKLELFPGQVTALVGENGAGKSTVVKILTGIYQPNSGSIRLNGIPTTFRTPQSASDSGITAIHQETVLFDELSVAENIFLGHAPRGRFGLIDWPDMESRAAEIFLFFH